MRVLVTGIGGFVGPVLAGTLRAAGHEVHGLVRRVVDDDRLTAVSLHTADVLDHAAVAQLVRTLAPEALVHLAGVTLPSAAEVDPDAAYRVNVGGTLAVLAAVRTHAPRARVLVVGTSEVYGAVTDDDLPVTEETPFRPVSVYGATKAAADIAAAQWSRAYGLDVVRVRPFNHTGPGQAPTFVCSALARQMAQVEAGKLDVVRVGNLDAVRDFSDVRDVVAGYVALLERGIGGEAYNICSGEGASIADVVAILRTHARVPVRLRIDPTLRRANDVPRVVGSHARATRDTGWKPAVAFTETLGTLLQAWRDLV